MLAMVTRPVTCPGWITAALGDGGGAEMVRLASRHGHPVSGAVTVRDPLAAPK